MKLGLAGTGILGSALSKRLLSLGHPLSVFNRTQSKANPLIPLGAVIKSSFQELIQCSDIIILMLSEGAAVREVLNGDDDHRFKGKLIIQMGTIAPKESCEMHKLVQGQGGEYFECPVLGSRGEAVSGQLILMMGGQPEQFKSNNALLSSMGKKLVYAGDIGKAAALKLALNHLIAMHACAFSLSLGIVQKNEINVDDFMDILKDSALYAPMVDKKLKNWINRSYDNPNFPVEHLAKDVRLILDEAQQGNLKTEIIESIGGLYGQAIKDGLSHKDYSAIFEIIAPS